MGTCDICGKEFGKQQFGVSAAHESFQEEFEFCSIPCLVKWTAQYQIEKRAEQAKRLRDTIKKEQPTPWDDDLDELREESRD